jgi:hypothetical protein
MAHLDYRTFEKSLNKLVSLPDPKYRRILDQLRHLIVQAEAAVERIESFKEK